MANTALQSISKLVEDIGLLERENKGHSDEPVNSKNQNNMRPERSPRPQERKQPFANISGQNEKKSPVKSNEKLQSDQSLQKKATLFQLGLQNKIGQIFEIIKGGEG